MARLFLDANTFIDLFEGRNDSISYNLTDNSLFISTLSLHIWLYVYKLKIPNQRHEKLQELVNLVPFTSEIARKALLGPTTDYEDNVQLLSCSEAECPFFITKDRGLLQLKLFGKTEIVEAI